MHKTESLLSIALQAAVEAGKEILRIYNSNYETSYKDDNSPLTTADLAAHRIIAERLSETQLPLLSEEGKDIPYADRKNWKLWWLVDPLDGTREFIKRNGEFTVNIALMSDNQPVAGVIYLPVKSLLYFGSAGTGSYRLMQKDNLPETVSIKELMIRGNRLPFSESLNEIKVLASRSHGNAETDAFIEELQKKHPHLNLLNAGSSYKFCLLAEGSATHYPRFGPTMEWDIAAGVAILQHAGGQIFTWPERETPCFNKPELLNPWFVALSKGISLDLQTGY